MDSDCRSKLAGGCNTLDTLAQGAMPSQREQPGHKTALQPDGPGLGGAQSFMSAQLAFLWPLLKVPPAPLPDQPRFRHLFCSVHGMARFASNFSVCLLCACPHMLLTNVRVCAADSERVASAPEPGCDGEGIAEPQQPQGFSQQ